MKGKQRLILLLLSLTCLALSVLLFNANRLPEKKKSISVDRRSKFTPSILDVVNTLPEKERKTWGSIYNQLQNSSAENKKTQWSDTAIVFWDTQNRPDIAAYFSGLKSEKTGKFEDLKYTGQRFYYAVKFFNDPSIQKTLLVEAKRFFEKALAVKPNDNDVKIDLASCIVESGENPMEGISMLREVEKVDSNNVKLQLSFGFFSAKSQQWDKAIKRFSKALKIDSGYIEGHLHLADAYERTGKKDECIKQLEMFISKTSDEMAKATIREYVNKLKH